VSSSVTLIEAQRLVRKLCLKCRESAQPPAALLQRYDLRPTKGSTFFKAVGCRACNRTGYRGRMGIIEVFRIDERLRELIVSREPSWEIKDYAVKALGMVPLRQDGFRKAQLGLTTLEEVMAVTTQE
jgi:type II secretory ATPase GspE/PulE/Tfp pilus assembly ATPase PilB-like protein